MSLQGQKVVSSEEMQRVEKEAFQKGRSGKAFMQTMGEVLFQKIKSEARFKNKAVLIAGKGNNAGDGFTALVPLLKEGFKTRALMLYKEAHLSPLCKEAYQKYLAAGGKGIFIKSAKDFEIENEETVIDGIFGTGLKGEMDKHIAKIIEKLNQTKNFKVSIDIPSGLDGNTGQLLPIAFKADKTFYLGFPKKGFFLEKGFEYVGLLENIDFGLGEEAESLARADFYLIDEKFCFSLLPKAKRTQHKYEAGYVVGIAGSPSMEGAANLSAKAALRSGAGLVRIFLAGEKTDYKKLTDEIIKEHLSQEKLPVVLDHLKKAQAVFIGPGLGRDDQTKKLFETILTQIQKPLVLDADALYFLAENPRLRLPSDTILTPHRGEMLRLLKSDNTKLPEEKFLEKCQDYTNQSSIILVLKGAPTFIFRKNLKPLVMARGSAGMATAGSGDVLTGIIASFLAKGLKAEEAAALGSFVHALAGEKAADAKTVYSMIASDLIESLPEVLRLFFS